MVGVDCFLRVLTFRIKILNRNCFKFALLLVWAVFFAKLQKYPTKYYLHHFLGETSERIVWGEMCFLIILKMGERNREWTNQYLSCIHFTFFVTFKSYGRKKLWNQAQKKQIWNQAQGKILRIWGKIAYKNRELWNKTF